MTRNGGALYIDEGRPAPGLVEKSVKNLLEVKPTLYFSPRYTGSILYFDFANCTAGCCSTSRPVGQ